jgi:phospholipase C
MANGSGLASVDHVVVLMLENRSFDHMLGFLYPGNVSPSGQPFDGRGWPGTLLVITYDEHGGCYDHVPPPWGAVPPDADTGEFGFGFDRFGVRVPTVLVSPLIAPGTVYRAPAGGTPLDHTSVLRTVEQRWNLPTLTARDAAAPAFGDMLTLATPRADDVLAGVTAPVSSGPGPAAGTISHLEAVLADLISRRYPAGVSPPPPPAAVVPAAPSPA